MAVKRLKAGLLAFLIIASVFSIYVPDVTAEQKACCEKTNSNERCVFTDVGNCAKGGKIAYTTCEQTNFCSLGCCYSSEDGSCNKNTPYAVCNAKAGSTFMESPNCDIAACQKGCCLIGEEAFFVTQTQCKQYGSQFPDLKVNFDSGIADERSCLEKSRSQEIGCCVTQDSCSFTTRANCGEASQAVQTGTGIPEEKKETTTAIEANANTAGEQTKTEELAKTDGTGELAGQAVSDTAKEAFVANEGFYKNALCSNDKLQCGCAKQHHTECYQGRVYWYDSCGNRENVYDASKAKSYNNGFVLPIASSCKAEKYDVDCGNCDYSQGTLCGKAPVNVKPKFGDLTCNDLNCYNTYDDTISPNAGNDKKHGESWCVYDKYPGLGKDRPGARHYRHLCIAGEEFVEPCEDFRGQLCVQGVLGQEVLETQPSFELQKGSDYVEGACRKNRFNQCDKLSTKSECENVAYSDCYWMEAGIVSITKPIERVGISGEIEVTPPGICVPLVPPGMKFWPDEEVVNLGRETPVGQQSATGKSPEIDAKETCGKASRECVVVFAKRLLPSVAGPKSECVQNCHCLNEDWIIAGHNLCSSQGDCGAKYNILDKVSLTGLEVIDEKNGKKFTAGMIEKTALAKAGGSPNQPDFFEMLDNNKGWAGLLGIASTGLISGILSGEGIKKGFDILSGPSILWGGLQSFIPKGKDLTKKQEPVKKPAQGEAIKGKPSPWAGLFDASGAGGVYGTINNWVNVASWLFTIYSLIDVFTTKYKTYKIATVCNPWIAPLGGKDCEKCNEKFKPCSEYKCRSLGQTCRLINPGTDEEKCINMHPNDVNSPIITPNIYAILKGFTIKDFGPNQGYEIKEGVSPYSPFSIGININEPSQCKYSTNASMKFDDMQFTFGSSLFLYNQTMLVSLPQELASVEALKQTKGIYTLYLKCMDASGNKNNRDYFIRFKIKPGRDLTPPIIEAASLKNNAYMANNVKETELSIFTNEPATCRYSGNDVTYENMKNEFTCSQSGFQTASLFYSTYECKTSVKDIKEGDNAFYFRCNDLSNNKNQEGFKFNLIGTKVLTINATSPSGEVMDNNITLELTTMDGAQDGRAVCGYKLGNAPYVEFSSTNSNKHTENVALRIGDYNYQIICSDIAGNEAKGNIRFKIAKDIEAPKLMFVYKDVAASLLHIELNEITSCEYSTLKPFKSGDGTKMTNENNKVHEASILDDANKFYITCQDEFKNEYNFIVYP